MRKIIIFLVFFVVVISTLGGLFLIERGFNPKLPRAKGNQDLVIPDKPQLPNKAIKEEHLKENLGKAAKRSTPKKLIPNNNQVPGSKKIDKPQTKEGGPAKAIPKKGRKELYLPILMYHHITLSPRHSSLYVSSAVFKQQMKYLDENEYHPITFRELISCYDSGEKIPAKSLIISFDDGWKEQYLNAFPVLKQHHFKATFFIISSYVGYGAFMNWQELEELKNYGMEIGSHTVDHPWLTSLSEGKLSYELKTSKEGLEKKLGQEVISFAYPYGDFNQRVIRAVKKAGYRTARSCREGSWQDLEHPYTLKTTQALNNLFQFEKLFPPR